MMMGQQQAEPGNGGFGGAPDPGLGATVAIDQLPDLMLHQQLADAAQQQQRAPGAFPTPGPAAGSGGFGGPPQGGGFGGPPQGQPQGGGFGGPPQGQPQGGGFGGQPMGAAAGAAFAGAMGGGSRPTQRNAWMTFGVSMAGFVIANLISIVIIPNLNYSLVGIFGLISSLFSLGGYVVYCLIVQSMVGELQGVTGDTSYPKWAVFVPIYNLIILFTKVLPGMQQAKQRAGAPPARSGVAYFFFWVYVMASDLNDLAAGGAGAAAGPGFGGPPQGGGFGGPPQGGGFGGPPQGGGFGGPPQGGGFGGPPQGGGFGGPPQGFR